MNDVIFILKNKNILLIIFIAAVLICLGILFSDVFSMILLLNNDSTDLNNKYTEINTPKNFSFEGENE